MKTPEEGNYPQSSNTNETLLQPQNTPNLKPTTNDLIAETFVLLSPIGKGAFGEIFLSYNLRDNIEIAIKKEVIRPNKPSMLKMESKVYQTMLSIEQNQDISGALALGQKTEQGVPTFYGFGELNDYSGFYLVMEFLGPNLNELLRYCSMKKFTISTVCLLAIQILNRIENVHKNGFLHRDIKPENFMIGNEKNSNIIYLIDFGLSRRYKNTRNNQHIPYREGRNLIGTARYVSINTHLGIEQSRRDDLESIGYMIIYFLKGYLPWQGLKGGQVYKRIMEKKLQIPTDILCLGLPEEVSIYLNYVKGLRFEDRPDYDFLRGLFIKTLSKCIVLYGLEKDYLKFDWNFEDPKTSIWEMYKEGGKKNENYNDNNINIPKDDALGNNKNFRNISINFANGNANVEEGKNDNNFPKMLTKIKECNELEGDKMDDGTLNKTNENDPNASIMSDDSSSMVEENENNKKEEKKKVKMKENYEKERENEEEKNSFKEKGELFDNKKINNLIKAQAPSKQNSQNKNVNSDSQNTKEKESNEIKQKVQYDNEKGKSDESSEDTINEEFSPNNLDIIKKEDIYSLFTSASTEKKIEMYINKLFATYAPPKQEIQKKDDNREQSPEKEEIAELKCEENSDDRKNEFKKENINLVKETQKDSKPMVIQTPGYKESTIIKDLGKDEYLKSIQKINPSEKKASSEKEQSDDEDKDNDKDKDKDKKGKQKEEEKKMAFKKELKKLKTRETTLKELRENEKIIEKSQQYIKEDFPKRNINLKFSKQTLIRIKNEPVTRFYVIKSDLGQGSYGTVKKVRHKKLFEDRAMKIVSKKTEGSNNEIEILRKISHPNIVNIFEIFEDAKKYYIIQELFDGGELFDFITTQGNFLESDAAIIMKQILNGVNYLHSQNIVHRDLKPENIMLVAKPNTARKYSLKIIDFGTAVQIVPGQKIRKFIGTSYYIAPEVLAENYDEKCDVWSCGVMMFILLCGYPPFNGSSNVDIFHNIQYSQPMFNEDEWKDISPSAIDLIKCMLNKNSHKRVSAEQALKHQWFKENENDDPFGLKTYKKKCNQLKAVNKMAEFVKENKFKQAVLQFITTQFDIKQEEENLKDIFKQFDVENTGQITKKVFLKELVKLYGEDDAKALTNKIFNTLDLDGNGDISYNEFLTAIIDNKKFITNDRLDKAFKMFDKDDNGKLSIEEIKGIFGGDDKKWKEIIREVDLNDDGEIDFEEFKMLMTGEKSKDLFEMKLPNEEK